MGHVSEVLFRIFYSTSFTIVFLVLIAFICVSPADSLYQSYHHHRILDIFLIAGAYIVTALLAALIYASRLYTNRSVLKDIPKTYIPLDKEELPGKRTWRLISGTIKRSAVIAQQTRPRAYRIEHEAPEAQERIDQLLRPDTRKNGDETRLVTHWGTISHPGWSSPADKEMPDLSYQTIVAELTDLLEAKAVSLAPINPIATPAEDGQPVPDARVIEALTRPDAVGMRRYVANLIDMEVLAGNETTTAFLTLYERARFAHEPLSEAEFKHLMRLFSDVLAEMKTPNLDLVDLNDDYEQENDEVEANNNDHDQSGIVHNDDDQADDTGSVQRRKPARKNSQYSLSSSINGSVRHYSVSSGRRRLSEDSVLRVAPIGEG